MLRLFSVNLSAAACDSVDKESAAGHLDQSNRIRERSGQRRDLIPSDGEPLYGSLPPRSP